MSSQLHEDGSEYSIGEGDGLRLVSGLRRKVLSQKGVTASVPPLSTLMTGSAAWAA